MDSKHIAAFAVLTIIQASACQAQDLNVCSKIVDHGLNNISLKTTAEAFADRLYWRFCDERYDSMSESKKTEFGATIKAIPFSLGSEGASASEKFSKFCGTYKTSTDRTSATSVLTNQMHDKAIDAWRSCVETTKRQMYIDFRVPSNQLYVDVSMKYTGPSGVTRFNGIEATGLACTYNGNPVGPASSFDVSPAEKQIRCERQSAPQEIGGVKANFYPDGGVTIKTDAGNSSIEFVSMIEGPARSRFELIEKNLASVSYSNQKAIGDLKSSLGNWPGTQSDGNLNGNGVDRGATMCPKGEYVVGVRSWGAPAEVKYCIGCVNGLRVVCAKLNTAN